MPRGLKHWASQAADALFIPGNAYNSNTGRWNPATTKVGIAGLIAGQAIPGGDAAVSGLARAGAFGQGIQTGLRNEGLYNTMADQYGDFREGLQNELRNTPVDVGGANPQVSVGSPQSVSIGNYAPAPQVPTMPAVQSQGPWTGLGTSSGGLFSGGALGNWASGGGQPQGHSFGQAAGSFTPWGAGLIQNDYWGGAAGGFGIGATNSGSGGGYAVSDAMRANKKNRD